MKSSSRIVVLKVSGLLAVVVFGAFLRWQAIEETDLFTPIMADAEQYMSAAYNLSVHGVYSESSVEEGGPAPEPTALRSPGFPFWASLFMQPSDLYKTADRVVMADWFLSVIGLLVLAALLYRVLPYWAALVTLAIVAINPHLVMINVYFLTEPLYILFITLVIAAYWLFIQKPGMGMAVVLGILVGLGSLIRPTMGLFVLPLAAFIFFKFPASSIRWKGPLAIIVLSFALTTSWNIRNVISTGSWSNPTLKANFLQHGMYPGFKYQDDDASFGVPYRYDPKNEEMEGDVSAVIGEIERRFREEPLRHLHWYLAGKPVFLHSWDVVGGTGDIYVYPPLNTPYSSDKLLKATYKMARMSYEPLLILGFLGVLLIWLPSFNAGLGARERHFFQFVSLLLLYFTAFHAIGAPFPRYGIPIKPLVFMQAMLVVSLFITNSRRLLRERKQGAVAE